ncbi:hypothetical protein AOLI_G00163800 [Acnodon oligacanthus]
MELSVVQTGLALRELSCAGMLPEDKSSDQVTDVVLLRPCSLLYSTIPLPLRQHEDAEMSIKPCGHQADRLKSSCVQCLFFTGNQDISHSGRHLMQRN